MRSVANFSIFTESKTVKTTALNHCVDCITLSSPAASPSLSWRAAEARFHSWRKLESGHKYFFIHSCESLEYELSFLELGKL